MQNIDEITDGIIRREGGYVNDPDDPGGATKFGVTIGTLRRLGLDLTGDNRINQRDVRALSREQAADIFKKQYFEAPKIGMLPAPLQPSVYDMYVNAGGHAVKILQRLLGEFGFPTLADGLIGPNTAQMAAQAMDAAPDYLVDAYGIARRNYYYGLGDARPTLRKFARRRDGGKGGWILRAEEFISASYRLSDAAHLARVRGWA
ncbi:MAG: holin-associated N-acetylmuramidase [Rhodobacteraceae bacterium]|nr:holin-associated N-acetylmuramidase [Paracoccaceae bacterium]